MGKYIHFKDYSIVKPSIIHLDKSCNLFSLQKKYMQSQSCVFILKSFLEETFFLLSKGLLKSRISECIPAHSMKVVPKYKIIISTWPPLGIIQATYSTVVNRHPSRTFHPTISGLDTCLFCCNNKTDIMFYTLCSNIDH